MTQETRETLTKMLERGGVDCGRPCAEFYPEEIAALRDVLTPRTCGTCRHFLPVHYGGLCLNSLGNSFDADDGCLKGWQAREGEGGEG